MAADMLWSVSPHCHESRWVLHDERRKRKISCLKEERACTKNRSMRQNGCMRKCAWSIVCKMGNHWEGDWVCAERPEIPLRIQKKRFAIIPHAATQEEALFSPLFSLTPQRSIKDKGTGWRDGNQPRVINQAMQDRDKTSIDKESWGEVDVPFPSQGSGVIRLSVEPLEGGVKRLYQQKRDKCWPLCAWELTLVSGM